MPQFDWDSVQDRAVNTPDSAILLSGASKVLLLDALAAMYDKFRWGRIDLATWDEIEKALALADDELMGEIIVIPDSFVDDFDRPDGPLNNGWAADGDFLGVAFPTMVIVGGWAIAPSNTPSTALYEADDFGPDLEIQADLIVGAVAQMALAFRLDDVGTLSCSGYSVGPDSAMTTIELRRINSTLDQPVIASGAVAEMGTGDALRVEVIGDEFSVYATVDSVESLVFTHTDTSPIIRAGKVGLYAQGDNVAYSRFEVQTL